MTDRERPESYTYDVWRCGGQCNHEWLQHRRRPTPKLCPLCLVPAVVRVGVARVAGEVRA